MAKRLSKTLWYGTGLDTYGKPLLPPVATNESDLNGLHRGELFMHLDKDNVTLWALSSNNEVVQIAGKQGEIDIDLSDYLLKSTWDKVWELRKDNNGVEYIYSKLPVITRYGITMYADNGEVEVEPIYAGLPIDRQTLIWKDGVLMVNPELDLGGGGGIDENELRDYLTRNDYAKKSDITTALSGYATTSALNAVSTKLNDFLEGSDTDTVINKWKELETFLSGLTESDNLATILTGKADKSYVDTNFVTIAGTEDVTGLHNFVNGLKVGGIELIQKNGNAFLKGNLVVEGGITMYGDGEGGSSVPLYSTLGSLLNVDESNDAVASVDRVLFQSAGSNVWSWKALSEIGGGSSGGGSVSGNYLPLSGGTIVGSGDYNAIPLVIKNGIASFSGINICAYNTERVHLGYFGSLGGIRLENLINNYGFAILDDGTPSFYKGYSDGTFTKNTILHTGNYSSYALPLTGGTIKGSVLFEKYLILTALGNGTYNIGTIGVEDEEGFNLEAPLDGDSWESSRRPIHLTWRGGYANKGGLRITNSDEAYLGGNKILHAGNYSSYALPLSGGQMSGHIYMTGAKADSSTANTTQIVFGTPSDNHVCITSNRYGIIINRSISDTSNQIALYTNADSESFIQSHLRIYGNLFSNIFFSHGGSVAKQSDASMYTWDNHLQINKRVGMTYVKTLLSFDLVNETATFNLDSQLRFNSNMFWQSDSTNPYMALVQGGHNWYVQISQGYMFLGAGATYSLRIDASGNILTPGGITMYSDIRKKTKLQDVELSLSQIANAPLIEHYYNSDQNKTTHVGSIAQYWAGINDWFCKLDAEGFYTMEIQNCALASAISIARHLEKYESKTDKKIRMLKKRVQELEDEVERLKKGA